MSGPTDENVPASGSAVPSGADPAPDVDDARPPEDAPAVRDEDAPPPAPDEGPDASPQGGQTALDAATVQDDSAQDGDGPAQQDTPGPSGHGELLEGPPDAAGPAEGGLEARPCAYCGRPVRQQGDSSPAVRYCADNEGACARAAAERRRRDQDAPGLAGQVARTWDMVERLEDVAELLAISLTGGLSVAGVERRLADARAEAAAGLAQAHREREASRLEAEQGLAQLGALRDRLARAEAGVAELTAQLDSARTERDMARDMGTQATRTAEAANVTIGAVRAERDRLTDRVDELTSALDDARDELTHLREELSDAKEAQKRSMALEETRTRLRAVESELDKMRTTAEIAQKGRAAAEQASAEADRQALEARVHAEEMSGERDEIVAERDSLATDLKACRAELEAAAPRLEESERLAADLESSRHDLELHQSRLVEEQLRSRGHAEMVDQLRGALATMITERDTARAEADEAKAEVERLIRATPPGARHARPQEFGAPAAAEGTLPPGQFPPPQPGHFPGSPGHDLPPGHDLGGVNGPPESFRRHRFLPPPEE